MSNASTVAPEILPAWLTDAAKRLRGITGFVTVHPNGGDPRTHAFSRYEHVTRVTSLALSLSEDRGLSRDETLLLSWLHDINRWPFAHNAERGNFEHADHIERFIAGRLPRPTVEQAVGVAHKEVSRLDRTGRTVLLADIATGFFEDTLFTITGLNLSPSELPSDALELLRLPVGDFSFLEELEHLYTLLNLDKDVPRYTRDFNSLVFRSTRKFLADHGFLDTDPLENARFWEIQSALRADYMEQKIFPLNNEKVCHGGALRQALVNVVVSRLGVEADTFLTRWTEADVVSYVLREGLASEETVAALAPTLDYVERFEPERRFM
ncbi:HD domain-containing protein [Streptomyces sp. A13(2022)]|uniref:HD domain-containing protein n=1 Tax=Streptomyces sp. A13(2022) TaxID=2964768 RepID=UPI0021D8E881|nr:HD domain-containing protein [Streptomyces sp. A13(2022)]MCU8592021.1 HD domain-containing protein [Streptomyces sp. A13(2022)]